MRNRSKAIVVTLIATTLISLLPCSLVMLLSSDRFVDYLKNTLQLTNGEFAEVSIGFFSTAISLLLGIVVYFQAQRINEIEIKKNATYLGVQDVDYSVDFGNLLFGDNGQHGLIVSHNFTTNKKVIVTSVNFLRRGDPKSIVIPLVFITKNEPLIVSLDFKKVTVTLMEQGTQICSRSFESDNAPICSLLCDDSHFVVGFGMLLPREWNVDQIQLEFLINVEDQNGVTRKATPAVVLHSIGSASGFYLTSSKSK